MTLDHKNPVLRVVPGPSDINANGHIFGGWVLSQMDIAAGIVASRRAGGSVATIAIERMEFIAPIHLRDVISVFAEVELPVLLFSGDDAVKVGAPNVEGATVKAEVIGHGRGDKIDVYKFKAKTNYRRHIGHRQQFTEVRITSVQG